MSDEIVFLNSKISRLLTERNEAEAKLEVFRIEVQNLRDHISSPVVQRNIREKVAYAKKIIEKKNFNKEDFACLKTLLLSLEERYARISENEKIYHRLLLQKEVENKNLKDFRAKSEKNYIKGLVLEPQDSKMSTLAYSPFVSVETGFGVNIHGRNSRSFCAEDFYAHKKEKKSKDYDENRLIDELAIFKVKHALFEENVNERDEKIKTFLRKLEKMLENSEVSISVKDTVSDIFETILKPVEQPDLQFD